MTRSLPRLPERVAGDDGLLLRRLEVGDAETLDTAVRESLDHLRPWMAWIAEEPLTIARRRKLLAQWERDWRAGDDVILGVFMDDELVGSSGLHHRIGPDGLEIGYWVHPGFTRRGIATRVSALLTRAAFETTPIGRVEIHTDRANVASSGVPHKLGFALLEEVSREPQAPGEAGVEQRWRLTRAEAAVLGRI
jgi:ribosomal-protein-serine acetyltransferase